VLLLAAAYGTMNLSLYSAIDRLGLGLAVTLEFLGPLAVALATSRRRADLACALVAGAGVIALTRPRPTTDYAGIGLGLLAAACWASYILLNRLIGRRLPGTQGSAAAAALSALAFVPVGIMVLIRHPPTVIALACAAAAGILSSAVPLLVDLFALRRVAAHYFGIFMSINPVLAAVIGQVVLGQSLPWSAWLSIAAIVAASAVSSVGAMSGVTPQAQKIPVVTERVGLNPVSLAQRSGPMRWAGWRPDSGPAGLEVRRLASRAAPRTARCQWRT
jgi:inner membrane transporter RhtA